MLCEIPKGSDVFYGISTFYGKNAEAFKLLGIAPEFILLIRVQHYGDAELQ